MTPQLQQAIRLLQLSTLDLQQEIQEALESNPLLEQEDTEEGSESEARADQTAEVNTDSYDETTTNDTLEASEAFDKNEMPDELAVDTTWEDVYSANTGNTGIALDDDLPIYQGETTESLQDYLMWQVQLTPFSETDRAIATAIIDAIDEKGYLTTSADEILDSLGDDDIELDEVEAVLKRVQQFDPLGVGSRNLQECLLLQLATFPEDTPWLTEAKTLLREHINLLANRDFRQLMRDTKLKEPELKCVMQLIHKLEPRPGNRVIHEETEYIVPDVMVFKHNGQWTVTINPDSTPKIRVNEQYAALGKHASSDDSQFIRNHLQEAKWLIKSLESRNETLLKVARCIVQFQQDFFEFGEEAMKPMVLNDVALEVDMHESTISRVTTKKYMHTPRGIFELKYFFSSHVSTDSGGECSSTAIRALVKKLVASENQAKPLSDSKIATLLADQGVMVARRTIAKYRESLGIPPSNQRKRLI
ncbi:RNA polymerase factor sigma-54 [Thaumasiovibrio sp. DFM-14]|uniref:RNA polymerase factor sigma-54 n=1 Tax=Thaumasiovibrio sp. DFM-14 TaxID=3384792 RepID=UPI0039A01DF9